MATVENEKRKYNMNFSFKTDTGKNGFVYGTAAPLVQPAPEKKKEDKRQEELEYLKASERKIEARARAEKNGLRAFTLAQTLTLIVFSVAVLFFCSTFIMQKCALQTEEKKLEALKKNYETLARENSLLEDYIENEIDYAYVYDYAVNVLSMSIPESHQIVTFKNTNPGYVVNNAAIPER